MSIREQEIEECRNGEIATWSDGTDRRAIASSLHFAYRHANAPSWFEKNEVEKLVVRAASAWAQCGIPSSILEQRDGDPGRPDAIVIEWNEPASLGHFGTANPARRTLALGPKAFALLRSRNPGHDARRTLQMVLSHEMGHFFGLMAHSRRCVDVLSYYHDSAGGKCFSREPSAVRAGVEYRHILPTACDIARCRAVNGLAPLPGGRLP